MNQKGKVHQRRQQKIGTVMLVVVLILYLLAWIFNTDAALIALQSTLDILKIIAPILLVIILIMGVINSYIHPKKLTRYLGTKSGIKGWFIAVIAGVLSHGPGYVWYPMLSDLREHGAKDGLIAAFIYARSVKLPWIPVMISYFGITFTIILTFFTLLGAIVQGMILQRLMPARSSD
jgi:uncharacterized membrane protein YraQ (UPF0718 family)